MENLQYSKILRKNWEIIALVIGVAVVLALIISLFQPFQYAASTKILIIQKQDRNLDAYTATKSAERIGKNLTSIMYTSSFYNEVIESNSTIKSKFSTDSRERRKEWEKNVKAVVVPETGIIEITAYDVDRAHASQLVRNIAYVLVNKGADYHGGGADVAIKIVDDVFISKFPVKPNIALNTLLAVVIGFLFGSAFVVLKEAKKANQEEFVQVSEINGENNFGFEPGYELAAEPVIEAKRTEIKTMYDHLQ